MRRIDLFLPVLSFLAACTTYDPLYCDRDKPCEDPERPFCDLEGEYPASDGIKKTCIPDPSGAIDGGDVDGTPSDASGARTVTKLVTAKYRSCALLSDGDVRCWGYVSLEENVGDGESPYTAGDLPTGGRVKDIATSGDHTCVLYVEGHIRCWGANGYGQLGYGHSDVVAGPPAELPDVPLGGPARQIALTSNSSCALLETGEVRCWGRNNVGQLGYGHTDNIGDTELPTAEDPVAVGGVATRIAAGALFMCAVLDGGAVRCWGSNSFGRLGTGSPDDVGDTEEPDDVPAANIGADVVDLAPGVSHTCALLEGGAVKCWGAYYAMGIPGNDQNIGDTEAPASIGNVDVGGEVVSLAAGDGSTCAVRADGQVHCWGNGTTYGRLGYPGTDPVGDDETPAEKGPVALGGPASAMSIGVNLRRHHCVLLQDGQVRCWGLNINGQLGLGHTEDVGDDETPDSEDPVQILDP